jgi:hypothetical protein
MRSTCWRTSMARRGGDGVQLSTTHSDGETATAGDRCAEGRRRGGLDATVYGLRPFVKWCATRWCCAMAGVRTKLSRAVWCNSTCVCVCPMLAVSLVHSLCPPREGTVLMCDWTSACQFSLRALISLSVGTGRQNKTRLGGDKSFKAPPGRGAFGLTRQWRDMPNRGTPPSTSLGHAWCLEVMHSLIFHFSRGERSSAHPL